MNCVVLSNVGQAKVYFSSEACVAFSAASAAASSATAFSSMAAVQSHEVCADVKNVFKSRPSSPALCPMLYDSEPLHERDHHQGSVARDRPAQEGP